ncbi:MAG: GNAT family N-acetyltransferase [Lachnospiraceae bacterium]|nr:GNAT family N-acetyltransferase [Lachnospiraceae bacterium]
MFYRLAEERDIDEIYSLIKDAICNMENHHIFQWDTWYPTKADFLSDIRKRQLIVGILNCNIAVVYVINQECDKAYQNGEWKYPDCEYRIIHRLCVNPVYQNQGIGTQTLSHIERELRKSGIEAVRLDVFSNNPFALSLYSNNGYKKVGYADWRKGRFYLMEKLL